MSLSCLYDINILKGEIARLFRKYQDEPDRYDKDDMNALRALNIQYNNDKKYTTLDKVIEKINEINSWNEFRTTFKGSLICDEGAKNTLDH
jgi:hypothetical protein